MTEFDRPSLDTIYNRMKADAEQRFGNTNWASRALVLILLAVFAGAIYLCYGFLRRLAKQLFFTTATDEFVRWHGRKYGLPRKAPEFAIGTVRFTGVNATSIPQYTVVENVDGVEFKTDIAAVIAAGIADVDITAVLSGIDGNLTTTSLTLVTPITDIDDECDVVSYITGTTNGTSGGVDEETKAGHISRLLQRTQNPPGSGNINDYERWAREIVGVGKAWGFDADDWLGAGTAAVVIASASLEPVSAAINAEVVTYIESKRPIGSAVTVADPIQNDVNFNISITPNNTTYQGLISTALDDIFVLASEPGGTLKNTDLTFAIKGTGVSDFLINNITVGMLLLPGTNNIEMTGLNLARFRTATYSLLS